MQQVISALKLHSESTREEVDYRLKAEKCAGTDELRKQELEELAKGSVHDIFDVDFGSRLCHPHPPDYDTKQKQEEIDHLQDQVENFSERQAHMRKEIAIKMRDWKDVSAAS